MGFSNKIKDQVLVKSARHCCVCRRYKGVGIEVHHITPSAEGGGDDIDNAIALCFDCHCSAGHYNPKHPRGIKFKPSELLKHRDTWWKIVESGAIKSADVESRSSILLKHIVCIDYEAAREVLTHKTLNIPFEYKYIARNQTFSFMERVLQRPLPYERDEDIFKWHSNFFDTREELDKALPKLAGRSSRKFDQEDKKAGKIPTQLLSACVNEGLPPEEVGRIVVYQEECGDPGYGVTLEIRRPIFVFCLIENVSDESLDLLQIHANTRDMGTKTFKPIAMKTNDLKIENSLANPICLKSGESLLVPQAILLGDPETDNLDYLYTKSKRISHEQGQDYGLIYGDNNFARNYFIIGPTSFVNEVLIDNGEYETSIPLHDFDPDHCYSLSRAWLCGSCPHLFLMDGQSKWHYYGEILTDGYRKQTSTSISIPNDIKKVRIAEVEPERTLIEKVDFTGSNTLFLNEWIEQNEMLEFDVSEQETITIYGLYECEIPKPVSQSMVRQKKSLLKAGERWATSRATGF